MVDRPLRRQIHLNRLSQETGPPLCTSGPAGTITANGCGSAGADNRIVCNFNGKSLKFSFTRAIQPPLLSSIEYKFTSGTPVEELAKYVSSQYPNAGPAQAIQQPSHGIPNCCVTWRWELDTNLSLFLIQEPSMPNNPQYILALGSSDILTRENQIIKQQQLNVNPKPKF